MVGSLAGRIFHFFFTAAFALLVLAVLADAYTDYSFTATAQVDADGNAHVVEKTVFTLDTNDERGEFDYYLGLSKTTLADWQKFSKKIKYHFTGSITGLKIIVTREFSVSYSAASVTLEYEVSKLFEGNRTTSRITEYRLNHNALAFSSIKSDEISLGTGMQLTILLPDDALNIRVIPSPGLQNEKKVLSWSGPVSGKWDVVYYREQPLSWEVNVFFLQLYEQLSTSGALLLILVVLAALILFKAFKTRKHS